MFITITSVPAEFPLPQFDIEGLPSGCEGPAISESNFRQILNIVRAGEDVEPIMMRGHAREEVNGNIMVVSRPRWRVSEPERETAFGKKLDVDLKSGKVPRFKVERVILRTDENGTQEAHYKLAGHDEPVRADRFTEPSDVVATIAGVVAPYDGKLVLFPFGGISELMPREPTGEVVPLKVEPTARGILSFLLYASYCDEQSKRHHYAWRYDEPTSKEEWLACEASARVLAGQVAFSPDRFHPLCGRFRIRRTEDGAVLDGFGDNSSKGDLGMMERSEAINHVERLRTYLAGYTPARMQKLTLLLEAIAEDFDPLTTDAQTAKERLADICLLLRETKKEHEASPVSSYWEPAARAEADPDFMIQGGQVDQS